MSSFEAVPTEIWSEIFSSHLALPELRSLSLVSHRFHALVEAELYKMASFNFSFPTPLAIQSYLRTILLRPILASAAQGLFVDTPEASPVPGPSQQDHPRTEENTSPEQQSTMKDETDITFAVVARNVKPPHPMDLEGELPLDLLSNLQSLSVSSPTAPYGYSYEPDNFLEVSAVFNRVLEEYELLSTQTVPAGVKHSWQVMYCPGDSELCPWVLLALLKIPNMCEIYVSGPKNMYHIRHSDDLAIGYSGTSSVTVLEFGWGHIDTLSLVRILDMPRALSKFIYSESGKPAEAFEATSFGVALSRFRETLQELILSFRWANKFWDDSEPEHGENGGIGSLRDWPVLCKVRCTAAILMGRGPSVATTRLVDMLPLVIEDVTIESDAFFQYEEVVDQIVEMVEHEEYGDLHQVKIVWQGKREDQRLRVACDVASVDLKVTWAERRM